jgi:hypothetical protein
MKHALKLSHSTTDELVQNILAADYISLVRGISKGLIVMAGGEEESWKQLVNSFEITMRYYLSEEEVEAIKEKANVLSSADQ